MRTTLLFLLLSCLAAGAEKPRVFVLTDISNEPDDEMSLVRYLVYSNEFDTEGLVATTSVWLRNRTRPELIAHAVDAYAKVRPNLLLHAKGYPEAAALKAVIRAGSNEFGMKGVGPGKLSDGAKLLLEAVAKPDPRPLWVTVWGGANTLAQALDHAKRTQSPAELDRLVAKLRVYTISDQDDSGKWLRDQFPGLYYIVSPSTVDNKDYYLATWTGIGGDRWYLNAPGEDFHLVDNPWLDQNIRQGHGPLGELYPRVIYIMEGDTPSFLNLISNGLASQEDPAWGGWGGRYVLRQSYGESRPIYTNSRDIVQTRDGKLHRSNTATIWRWREAFQFDFAARMDWCVQPFNKANHPPLVTVNKQAGKDPLLVAANSGDSLTFSAAGTTDPDGNQLAYRWFFYWEAGTFGGEWPKLDGSATETVNFTVPPMVQPSTLHVILEALDDGTPRLRSYRRMIVTVNPN